VHCLDPFILLHRPIYEIVISVSQNSDTPATILYVFFCSPASYLYLEMGLSGDFFGFDIGYRLVIILSKKPFFKENVLTNMFVKI
jgi:hypothetical protein